MNTAPAIAALGAVFLLGVPSANADPFAEHWFDGKAELAGYELVQPRYGEARKGRAILVFVTEPYSKSMQVKVDRYNPRDPDHVQVLKLNFVKKFQTGIYDYSLMTSAFAVPSEGFRPLKVSFSSQEWCGHTYEELTFDQGGGRLDVRSYFEGETSTAKLSGTVVPEELLFIQLRQLANGKLEGSEREVELLASAATRRLRHQRPTAESSRIRWSEAKSTRVPAGTMQVRTASYMRAGSVSCEVDVETAYPHRIAGWRCSDGEVARLRGSSRLPYWQLHGEGQEKLLSRLGLTPPDPDIKSGRDPR